MRYQFGTVTKSGKVLHNTHSKEIGSKSAYEWECLIHGEQLPKTWDENGEIVEWEFLENKADN